MNYCGKEQEIEDIFQFLSQTGKEENRILGVKIKTFPVREPLENFLNFYEVFLLACHENDYDIAKKSREIADLELSMKKNVQIPFVRWYLSESGTRILNDFRVEKRMEEKLFNRIKRRFFGWKKCN